MSTTIHAKPHNLRRVYVWELPVRIYHWLNALCILVLIATGFYIADPLALQSHHDASSQFTMGWVKVIHYITAYVFFFNFVFRIYWGFVGNKEANWRRFIPTNKKFFKGIWQVFKIDILMMKGKEQVHAGHNPMAGFIYFFMFLLFLVQCITGFGLYAATTNFWFPKLFAWVPYFLGGDHNTLLVHHVTMWLFILFTFIHVYLVFYHDYIEGRGEISSMGGGWKFLEQEVFDEANAPVITANKSEELKTDESKKNEHA